MQRPARDWGRNLVAFVFVIVLNFLSNGQTMLEISATYPSLFTPAGFTFAICGVIYAFDTYGNPDCDGVRITNSPAIRTKRY